MLNNTGGRKSISWQTCESFIGVKWFAAIWRRGREKEDAFLGILNELPTETSEN